MDFSNIRFYIQMRFKLGCDATSIHNDFVSVYGDQAPAYSTITKWIREFKGGRTNLEDEPRSGAPITGPTAANIEVVRVLIENNPYLTYDELEAQTMLSRGTLERTIIDCLQLRKVASRYVPHFLSEKNRKDRVRICEYNLDKFKSGSWRLCDVVTGDESIFFWKQIGRRQSNASWVAKGESPRTVIKRSQFDDKTMVCIFFSTKGVETITYWDKGNTIDQHSYVDDCLKPLVKVINGHRNTCGTNYLKFHHDNARPHVAKKVIDYLKDQNFVIIDHPPYSPDLAPSDFWLFDYIKQRLDDHTNAESLVKQITKIVSDIPKNEWQKTFNKWIERMELCVKYKGDYFEHIISK